MSSNLPSSRGPGGREVVRAERAGADGAAGRPQQEREATPREATPREVKPLGAGVRSGQLGGRSRDGQPTETDRRRLRTQRALRSPRAVRQAILLRELLGPPVALRRHREDPPSLTD